MSRILSEKFYAEMKKLEPRYPTKVALLLPALHAAQDETGWISQEVIDEVALYIGCHPAQVREVASFYTMYHLKPVGKNVIRLCTNVACALRGAEELMHHCEKRLNIKCGETTSDLSVTLLEEECLGACGTAPALMLNNKEYHESLDVQKMDALLNKCLASGS